MISTVVNDEELQRSLLLMIIDPENLERMRKADPFTLDSEQINRMSGVRYPQNLSVIMAYEEDSEELVKVAEQGRVGPLITYLMRGYHFKPGIDGDTMTKINLSGKEDA